MLDADANAACNILARMYDDEITLYMSHGEVKALLAERTKLSVGTARPGLELRCNRVPINRERITGAGTEVCRLYGTRLMWNYTATVKVRTSIPA